MSLRRNEFAKYQVWVMGYNDNKKKEEVRYKYPIQNIADQLDKYQKAHKSLKASLIDLPNEASGKYQKIGIHDVKKTTQSKIDFYHFVAALIFRDNEDISTINLKDATVEVITLGKDKYMYVRSHVTVIPKEDTIVLDSHWHNSPAQYFFRCLVANHTKGAEYRIPLKADLLDKTHVKIAGVLAKDYETVLKNKFSSIQEIGITVAKPGAKKSKTFDANMFKESSKETLKLFQSTISKLFGVDALKYAFGDLPLKRIKLNLVFDERVSNTLRKDFKKNSSQSLGQFVKNAYLDESYLRFHDGKDGKLQKVILNGITRSEECNLDPKHYGDDDKMWEEQKRLFFELREEE